MIDANGLAEQLSVGVEAARVEELRFAAPQSGNGQHVVEKEFVRNERQTLGDLRRQVDQNAGRLAEVHHWSHGHKRINGFRTDAPLRQQGEHRPRPVTMANVADAADASFSLDVADGRGKVLLGKLVHGEVPVEGVIGAGPAAALRVLVSSKVHRPHVVALAH